MKKVLILAGICLAMCVSAIAQDNAPRQGGGQRMRRSMDAVVDTAIINHLGIDEAVLKQVYALQENKQAEQRAMFQNGGRRERGQRMSEEERKAMQEKREAFNAQYRKELRALIGDETYITYLEKMCDRIGMMRMMGMGGQRQGGMPGGQRQGGFGGGGFGGGDFGGGNGGF